MTLEQMVHLEADCNDACDTFIMCCGLVVFADEHSILSPPTDFVCQAGIAKVTCLGCLQADGLGIRWGMTLEQIGSTLFVSLLLGATVEALSMSTPLGLVAMLVGGLLFVLMHFEETEDKERRHFERMYTAWCLGEPQEIDIPA